MWWKSERMCEALYRAAGGSLTSVPPACFRILPKGLRVGRNTGDANSNQLAEGPLQDFHCSNGWSGAWFATDLTTESPTLTIDLFDLRGYDPRDDLERCLEPYPGITTLYRLTRDVRLWDMSSPDALFAIRTFLQSAAHSAASDVRLLDACFRFHDRLQAVVRHSTPEDDVALCRLLVDRGLFTPDTPGWYHPTMWVFNEEDEMRIERIHRREIVLMNPAQYMARVSRIIARESGVAAPKRARHKPRSAEQTDVGSVAPRSLFGN